IRMAASEARAIAAEMRADAFAYPHPFEMARPLEMVAPAALAPFPPRFFDEGLNTRAPAAWAQGDPADSVWRIAQESNNRGDYPRAAQLFSTLSQKYPKSAYVGEAMYWEAFARYRLGSTQELETAAKVLEN